MYQRILHDEYRGIPRSLRIPIFVWSLLIVYLLRQDEKGGTSEQDTSKIGLQSEERLLAIHVASR